MPEPTPGALADRLLVQLDIERAARADAERRARELAEARATNTRLHRRVQAAEAAARTTVEECRRAGVSLGRSLAVWAAGNWRTRAEQAESQLALAFAWGVELVTLFTLSSTTLVSVLRGMGEYRAAAEERGARWMREAAVAAIERRRPAVRREYGGYDGDRADDGMTEAVDAIDPLDPAEVCAEARAREANDG